MTERGCGCKKKNRSCSQRGLIYMSLLDLFKYPMSASKRSISKSNRMAALPGTLSWPLSLLIIGERPGKTDLVRIHLEALM